METTPQNGARVYARTHPKHWININAEDIPPGWIDDMVKRLFEELNRQMLRVERTSKQVSDKKLPNGEYKDDPEEREQHAQTLSSLQRSLERLIVLETGRLPARKVKRNEKPGETRARLQRRLAEQLESSRARDLPGKSE
jgi:hypothetical protein